MSKAFLFSTNTLTHIFECFSYAFSLNFLSHVGHWIRLDGPPIGYSVGYSDGYSCGFVANSSWKLSFAEGPLLTGLFMTAGFFDPNGSSVYIL